MLNSADLGAAILVSVGRTKKCVSAVLAFIYLLKSILIIEVKSYKTCFRAKNLHSGRLTLGGKKPKLMESSSRLCLCDLSFSFLLMAFKFSDMVAMDKTVK